MEISTHKPNLEKTDIEEIAFKLDIIRKTSNEEVINENVRRILQLIKNYRGDAEIISKDHFETIAGRIEEGGVSPEIKTTLFMLLREIDSRRSNELIINKFLSINTIDNFSLYCLQNLRQIPESQNHAKHIISLLKKLMENFLPFEKRLDPIERSFYKNAILSYGDFGNIDVIDDLLEYLDLDKKFEFFDQTALSIRRILIRCNDDLNDKTCNDIKSLALDMTSQWIGDRVLIFNEIFTRCTQVLIILMSMLRKEHIDIVLNILHKTCDEELAFIVSDSFYSIIESTEKAEKYEILHKRKDEISYLKYELKKICEMEK